MGLLIVRRHPRHRIGWLLLVAGTSAVSLALESYSWWVVQSDGPGPELAGHVAAWASLLLSAPLPITAIVLVYLLAPTGHLPSPRWRWVARGAVAGPGCYLAGVAARSRRRRTRRRRGRQHRDGSPEQRRASPCSG
jgi:hypothetical protein